MSDFVQEFLPHIIGITANTPQVKQAWRTASAIKQVHDVPIVLGGPHVSVLPEESCAKPDVDIVVRGEEIWLEICDRVERFLHDQPHFSTSALMHPKHEIFADCLGVTYKTSDGAIHHNPDRPALADLDTLPWPAYHLFKMERYTNLQPATDNADGARSFSVMFNLPRNVRIALRTFLPKKEKSGLRRAVESGTAS